ncbi:MAG: adenylate kinase [Acidimicrobiia bacterium]|nr:adenylate kinase [Acidimicrobiia bacterium]
MAGRLRAVIFGRQGAGKGTQSARLSAHYGAPHISTGDMLRAAVSEGTEFGRKADEYMRGGNLVPDDVMIGVVRERLAKPDAVEGGFLLDGFPRTLGQSEALLDITGDDGIDVVIDLDVPLDVVTARMKGRGRADDTDEAIARRLELYEKETGPVLAWFERRGKLVTVDGVGTEEEVFARLSAAVDRRLGQR